MTLAEKFFRQAYKIKSEAKLTNEQWKIVNTMHNCLKENNKTKLPNGTILVEKKQLIQHLNNVKRCLKLTDDLMLNPEHKLFSNGAGGTELAKIWNSLNLTFQSISHFQLNIPLERLIATEMEDLK